MRLRLGLLSSVVLPVSPYNPLLLAATRLVSGMQEWVSLIHHLPPSARVLEHLFIRHSVFMRVEETRQRLEGLAISQPQIADRWLKSQPLEIRRSRILRVLGDIKPGADLSHTEFWSQESNHREVVPVGRVLSWPVSPVSEYAVFKQEFTTAKGSLQQKDLVPPECYRWSLWA